MVSLGARCDFLESRVRGFSCLVISSFRGDVFRFSRFRVSVVESFEFSRFRVFEFRVFEFRVFAV